MPETSASNADPDPDRPRGRKEPKPPKPAKPAKPPKPPKPPKAAKPPKPEKYRDPRPVEPADPQKLRISDPDRMKALAHPARMAVFDYLGSRRVEGYDGATATEIAEVADITPSAMSYHLRTLAKAGFIEEAPNRGDARERVWRLAIHSFSIEAEPDAPESAKVVETEMVRAFRQQEERNFARWLAVKDQLGPELKDSSMMMHGRLRLTPAEAKEFHERVLAVELEYSQLTRQRIEEDADDGSAVFTYVFRIFPHV